MTNIWHTFLHRELNLSLVDDYVSHLENENIKGVFGKNIILLNGFTFFLITENVNKQYIFLIQYTIQLS